MDEFRLADQDPDRPARAASAATIQAALACLYTRQAPRHCGPSAGERPGRLADVLAFKRITPAPHWHLVSEGFSLAGSGGGGERAGFGFELSLRVADPDDSEDPPAWAVDFLRNLADYVFASGNAFHAGHYLDANGPLAADTDSALRVVAFARDPELPPVQTGQGEVEFLQAVGLTYEEAFALKRWAPLKVLEVLADALPLWITDLERGSLLADPDIAARLSQGAAREGSSVGVLYTQPLQWSQRKRLLRAPLTRVLIGAHQVGELLALLPLRLPFGQRFSLVGPDARVVFEPGPHCRIEAAGEALHVQLDEAARRGLGSSLRSQPGVYSVMQAPGLEIEVTAATGAA